MRPLAARRALLILLAAGAVAGAHAAEPVTRPVRFVVGFPPGGGGDLVARLVAQPLAETLGQSIVVDNRAGAGGIVGAELVARAAPDGHTLLLATTGAISVSPSLQPKLPYDPLTDFAPIGMIGSVPNAIVVPAASPLQSLPALIEAAKRSPGKLNYGSTGIGATPHLAGEMMRIVAGIDIAHVAYRGAGPAMTDLLAGRLDCMFPTLPSVLSQIRAGRLRALAVTGSERAASLPEAPTVAELGWPAYRVVNWFGILAPARTPADTVERLGEGLRQALARPDAQEKLAAQGLAVQSSTSAQLRAFMKDEAARWRQVVSAAKIKPE